MVKHALQYTVFSLMEGGYKSSLDLTQLEVQQNTLLTIVMLNVDLSLNCHHFCFDTLPVLPDSNL